MLKTAVPGPLLRWPELICMRVGYVLNRVFRQERFNRFLWFLVSLIKNSRTLRTCYFGCVWLGNPDLDFQNLNPHFPIEREIRKRISPPRNPSSGWISIKKSKSGFFGFPFYRSIGKSEKGFAKLFSWTAVFFLLIMRARARPLFLSTAFQILFWISQSNGKNENPKTDISARSARLNPFSDFAFDCKSEIRILKSKSRFPNRTHPYFLVGIKTFEISTCV